MSTIGERRYGSEEVCRLADISYRKLDYWVRLGLVPCSDPTPGSGRGRWFTDHAVMVVRMVKVLVSARVAHSLIRKAVEAIAWEPAYVWVEADRDVRSGSEADMLAALAVHHGLLVVNLAHLGHPEAAA